MIIILCHKVISKNGNIGEFAYGCDVKQKLLEIEDIINQ
ncbi:MGMT family protein [bacterium]|nr:MGMT family protein [bacterium]